MTLRNLRTWTVTGRFTITVEPYWYRLFGLSWSMCVAHLLLNCVRLDWSMVLGFSDKHIFAFLCICWHIHVRLKVYKCTRIHVCVLTCIRTCLQPISRTWWYSYISIGAHRHQQTREEAAVRTNLDCYRCAGFGRCLTTFSSLFVLWESYYTVVLGLSNDDPMLTVSVSVSSVERRGLRFLFSLRSLGGEASPEFSCQLYARE